jgi:hypothetical protein
MKECCTDIIRIKEKFKYVMLWVGGLSVVIVLVWNNCNSNANAAVKEARVSVTEIKEYKEEYNEELYNVCVDIGRMERHLIEQGKDIESLTKEVKTLNGLLREVIRAKAN